MPTLKTLTDRQIEMLQELWDAHVRRPPPRPRSGVELNDGQSPEVYLAKAPLGIPAMTAGIVGSGDADVYQVLDTGALDGVVFEQPVYNPTAAPIQANVPFLVIRDKFGTWFVCSAGASAFCANEVTVEETDVRCEAGLIKKYNRTVSIGPNPATGCLDKSVTAWVWTATVGCCDDTCTGTGTDIGRDWWCIDFVGTATSTSSMSTGTGTGSPDVGYWCLFEPGTGTGTGTPPEVGTGSMIPATCGPCANIPISYRVTIAGVADNDCTGCSVFNGTHVLTFFETGQTVCHWIKLLGGSISCAGTTYAYIVLQVDLTGNANLYLGCSDGVCTDGGTLNYRNLATWECESSNVLTVDQQQSCTGPATLTVEPL